MLAVFLFVLAKGQSERAQENANLATEMVGMINQEQQNIVDEIKTANSGNLETFQTQIQLAEDNLQKLRGEQEADLATVRNTNQQSLQQMQGELRSANQKEQDHYKEITTRMNEIKGMANDVDSLLENAQTSVEGELSRLQQQSNKFPTVLARQVNKVSTEAQKVASGVEEQVRKTIEDVKKEMQGHVIDQQNLINEKQKSLEDMIEEVQDEISKARTTTKDEVNNGLDESYKKTLEVEEEVKAVAVDAANIRALALKQNEETGRQIDGVGTQLQDNLAQAATTFGLAKDDAVASANAAITVAKDAVLGQMQRNQETVKEEIGQKLQTVQDSITTGASLVQQTKSEMQEQVVGFNNQINEQRAAIQKVENETTAMRIDMMSQSENIDAEMNETRGMTENSLKELTEYVDDKLANTSQQVVDLESQARTAVSTDLTSTKNDLINRINSLQSSLSSNLQEEDKNVEASGKKAQSLMDKLQSVSNDVNAEKEQVTEALPRVETIITSATSQVKSDIRQVNDALDTAREDLNSKITQTQRAIDTNSQQQVERATSGLRKQLTDSEDHLTKVMGDVMSGLGKLKAESAQKYTDREEAEKSLHALMEQAIGSASKLQDESQEKGAQIEAKVQEALAELQTAEKANEHSVQTNADGLKEMLTSQVRKAEREAANRMHKQISDSTSQLNVFEKSVANQIQGDESKLDSYRTDSKVSLDALTAKVKDLGFTVEKRELATQRENKDLAEKLQRIGEAQVQLEQKSTKDEAAEKMAIDARAKELQELIGTKVEGLQRAQAEKIDEMVRETNSVFQEEKTRAQLDQGKVTGMVNEWQGKLQSEVRNIQKTVDNTKQELDQYRQADAEAQQNFHKEVDGLDRTIASGQQRVQSAVDAEDKRIAALLGGELGGMDHLLALLRTTQDKSKSSLAQAQEHVADQIRYYEQKGHAQANELQQKLDQLEGSARELAAEFKDDSDASKKQLAHTQFRLSKVVNETQRQMDSFRGQIGDVRSRREQEASSLQQQSSSLKQQLTTSMGETVEKIEQMRQQLDAKFQQLSTEQNEYDKKLAALVGMSSNRDQELLQTMEAKMDTLEENNKRLMNWQNDFKSRTLTWRQEVERRVQQLQETRPQLRTSVPSSFVETGSGSEVEALRAMNAELTRENARLTKEDKALDERVKHIEQVLTNPRRSS